MTVWSIFVTVGCDIENETPSMEPPQWMISEESVDSPFTVYLTIDGSLLLVVVVVAALPCDN